MPIRNDRLPRRSARGILVPWLAAAAVAAGGGGALYWTTSDWRLDRVGPMCTLTRSVAPRIDEVVDDKLPSEEAACRRLASRAGLVAEAGGSGSGCPTVDLAAVEICSSRYPALKATAEKVVITPLSGQHNGMVDRRGPGLIEWMLSQFPWGTGGSSIAADAQNAPTTFSLRRGKANCLAVLAGNTRVLTAAHCLQDEEAPSTELISAPVAAELACSDPSTTIAATCEPAVPNVNWSQACRDGSSVGKHCYRDIAACTLRQSISTPCVPAVLQVAEPSMKWPHDTASAVSVGLGPRRMMVNAVDSFDKEPHPFGWCETFAKATMRTYVSGSSASPVTFRPGDSGGPIFQGSAGNWTLVALIARTSSNAVADVVPAAALNPPTGQACPP